MADRLLPRAGSFIGLVVLTVAYVRKGSLSESLHWLNKSTLLILGRRIGHQAAVRTYTIRLQVIFLSVEHFQTAFQNRVLSMCECSQLECLKRNKLN